MNWLVKQRDTQTYILHEKTNEGQVKLVTIKKLQVSKDR